MEIPKEVKNHQIYYALVNILMKKFKPRPKNPDKPRNMYFNNPLVEDLLRKYVKAGCTNLIMRNEIMSHASELIRQVIRTHGLYAIYGGGEDSSFNDLFQIAWVQIEKTLYKFDYSQIFTLVHKNGDKKEKYKIRGLIKEEDNLSYIIQVTRYNKYIIGGKEVEYNLDDLVEIKKCDISSKRYDNTKVFNMWSQIAKTVALAHIKKDSRDKKNYNSYSSFLKYKPTERNLFLDRFFDEAESICKYDEDEMKILNAIKTIADEDLTNASNGLITKIMLKTELSRQKIVSFFKKIRTYQGEFSDAPNNIEQNYVGNSGGSTRRYNLDAEDDF